METQRACVHGCYNLCSLTYGVTCATGRSTRTTQPPQHAALSTAHLPGVQLSYVTVLQCQLNKSNGDHNTLPCGNALCIDHADTDSRISRACYALQHLACAVLQVQRSLSAMLKAIHKIIVPLVGTLPIVSDRWHLLTHAAHAVAHNTCSQACQEPPTIQAPPQNFLVYATLQLLVGMTLLKPCQEYGTNTQQATNFMALSKSLHTQVNKQLAIVLGHYSRDHNRDTCIAGGPSSLAFTPEKSQHECCSHLG